jgi:hypothetical protein
MGEKECLEICRQEGGIPVTDTGCGGPVQVHDQPDNVANLPVLE